MPDAPHTHDYDYWRAALEGVTLRISPDRVPPGFWLHYRRDGVLVGVATFPFDGAICVKYGDHPTKILDRIAEEDWSWNTFSWLQPVEEAAYRTWSETGAWPADVEARARAPKKSRKKPEGTSA